MCRVILLSWCVLFSVGKYLIIRTDYNLPEQFSYELGRSRKKYLFNNTFHEMQRISMIRIAKRRYIIWSIFKFVQNGIVPTQ